MKSPHTQPRRCNSTLNSIKPEKWAAGQRSTFSNPQKGLERGGRRASDKTRKAVKASSGNRCFIEISPDCLGIYQGRHHVKSKGQGGKDTTANCLPSCNACNGWVEDNTFLAAAMGARRSGKYWFNERRHLELKAGRSPAGEFGLDDAPPAVRKLVLAYLNYGEMPSLEAVLATRGEAA